MTNDSAQEIPNIGQGCNVLGNEYFHTPITREQAEDWLRRNNKQISELLSEPNRNVPDVIEEVSAFGEYPDPIVNDIAGELHGAIGMAIGAVEDRTGLHLDLTERDLPALFELLAELRQCPEKSEACLPANHYFVRNVRAITETVDLVLDRVHIVSEGGVLRAELADSHECAHGKNVFAPLRWEEKTKAATGKLLAWPKD